jgi:hypothetical protein
MKRGLVTTIGAAGFGLLAASGCMTNTSGDLAAEQFGDLSNPLGAREDAYGEIDAACGLAAPDGMPSSLRRRPYLQQVQSDSAQLLWTSDASMSAPSVQVSLPNGTVITEVAGAPDASARPPEGAVQWLASIQGLQPDTLYCYELDDPAQILRRGGFRTAPLPGSGRTLRILAFGDTGDGSADQASVLEQIRTVPFDVAIHMGDLAYNVGARPEIERNYFRMYGDLLERIPVFPISGNHEYDTEEGAPFREAFSLPRNGGPEGEERWYSFDWGDVHFVALDTERVNATQAAWLDADLTANKLPWTIVFHHRPAYSSGQHGSTEGVQRVFVPLFEKHRVPLVLAGHDHDYERTKPLNGVTYVVTGAGGVGTRPVGHSAFTAFSESVCHFAYITVSGDTLTLHAIDGMGSEFDSLALHR